MRPSGAPQDCETHDRAWYRAVCGQPSCRPLPPLLKGIVATFVTLASVHGCVQLSSYRGWWGTWEAA